MCHQTRPQCRRVPGCAPARAAFRSQLNLKCLGNAKNSFTSISALSFLFATLPPPTFPHTFNGDSPEQGKSTALFEMEKKIALVSATC